MPPSSKKSQQRLRNQSTELPLFKSPLVLRLTADLFRQHADLYQQHAAILERVSANPNSIQAWQLEEPCPERIAARVQEEETTTLALKGYQGMLQVQKRVNHMERLVKRNGVGVKTYVVVLDYTVNNPSCHVVMLKSCSFHHLLARAEFVRVARRPKRNNESKKRRIPQLPFSGFSNNTRFEYPKTCSNRSSQAKCAKKW